HLNASSAEEAVVYRHLAGFQRGGGRNGLERRSGRIRVGYPRDAAVLGQVRVVLVRSVGRPQGHGKYLSVLRIHGDRHSACSLASLHSRVQFPLRYELNHLVDSEDEVLTLGRGYVAPL